MAREQKASTPVSTDSEAAMVHQQIASLAYLKAEARGFLPGCELRDWLEAEMEINGSRARPEKHWYSAEQNGNDMVTAPPRPWAHDTVPSQSDLATLFLNEDGLIEDCSSACESVFGYPKQDLHGHHVSMLLPRFEGIELVIHGQINPRLRFLYRCAPPFLAERRDGTKFAREVFLSQLINEAGGVQIIVRDLGVAAT
jgi:PAS domain S-box-containing protein